jgi:hypothetical protein
VLDGAPKNVVKFVVIGVVGFAEVHARRFGADPTLRPGLRSVKGVFGASTA